MGFEFYKESYAGSVRTVSIGEGSNSVVVGGESCYPFYQFEGDMPYKPRIAMEIWDMKPEDWPEAVVSPFKDVIGDVGAWAKKCVDSYGAEIIVLQLKSIDPNGQDASPEEAVLSVKKVLDAVQVPLIVWGVANADKDEIVFKKIAEECQSYNLILGPVEDKNHKAIGAAAMGYGHGIISSSPIDVNLAKQVNILLENLGMSMDKVLIDPTTGGLGYGLEYSYSVMERLRMAAITQGDDKLQMPIINNLGNEVWKSKEAKQSTEDAPLLGDPEKRGVLMESVAAVAYLMAGSNVLVMRHPESIRLIKSFIDLMMEGGVAAKVDPINKSIEAILVDFEKLSPLPDLTIETVSDKKSQSKSTSKVKVEVDKVKKISEEDKKHKDYKVEIKDQQEKASEVVLEDNQKEDRKILENISKIEVTNKSKEKIEQTVLSDIEKEKIKEKEETRRREAERIDMEKKEKEKRMAMEEAERVARKEREAIEEAIRTERAAKSVGLSKGCLDRGLVTYKVTAAPEQKKDFEKIIDELSWIHRRASLYKW